jgi:hypothetical protein
MLMNASNKVKYALDPNDLPSPTQAQQQRLAAIATMPDTAIDYSDIPCQTAPVQWTRPSTYSPLKTSSK